jgi:hypothetical protein
MCVIVVAQRIVSKAGASNATGVLKGLSSLRVSHSDTGLTIAE